MEDNLTGGANHEHVHADVAGQLGQKVAGLLQDKKETDASLNPNSTIDASLNPNSTTDEWPPCPTPFPDLKPSATWAATLAMAPPPPPISAQSEALAKAAKIQRRAIKATKKFFSAIEEDFGSESDDETGSESECEFESSDSESQVKPDMDEFFGGIFIKDHKLREYYKNNSEKGNFYCFICQVRKDFKGKGMRYKSGLALVQHANTVSKAGWSGAHRALAKAVCWVLGWDPVKIPCMGARSPSSEVVAETGDFGTEQISKEKDSDHKENFENNPSEDPKGTVLKIEDFSGDKEEKIGDISEEPINPVKTSGSPFEEKKEFASNAA